MGLYLLYFYIFNNGYKGIIIYMYAFPKITNAIKIILIVHGIGFLFSIFMPETMRIVFGLGSQSDPILYITFIWKIFTYPIVGHTNIIGLLFFALFMWWVGSRLEESWGTKLFVTFYLVTISVSGLLILPLISLIGDPQLSSLYGTTGLTFAIIAVYAYIAPNLQFYIFGIFPMKVKWLLLISIILTFASGAQAGASAGSVILYNLIIQIITGLVAVTFVFINFSLPTWIIPYAKGAKDWVEKTKTSLKNRTSRKNFTVYTNNQYNKSQQDKSNIENEESVESEVDRILDKISKYGIDTLTKKEKEFLDKAGEQYKANDSEED